MVGVQAGRHVTSSQRGYTLTELVVVLVLLGLFSMVLIGNDDSRRQQSLQIQAEQLRRDLSRLQLQAIAKGERVALRVQADGAGYSAIRCLDQACLQSAALVQDADGQALTVSLTDGVRLSADGALVLDSLGRPQSTSGLRTAPLLYVFSASGLASVVVVVEPLTGWARLAA